MHVRTRNKVKHFLKLSSKGRIQAFTNLWVLVVIVVLHDKVIWFHARVVNIKRYVYLTKKSDFLTRFYIIILKSLVSFEPELLDLMGLR